MSIKITLVENHINRNFKQYNIDDFTIKENFGSYQNLKIYMLQNNLKGIFLAVEKILKQY